MIYYYKLRTLAVTARDTKKKTTETILPFKRIAVQTVIWKISYTSTNNKLITTIVQKIDFQRDLLHFHKINQIKSCHSLDQIIFVWHSVQCQMCFRSHNYLYSQYTVYRIIHCECIKDNYTVH